jgi:multiple sugar transport system substrate-binding protein
MRKEHKWLWAAAAVAMAAGICMGCGAKSDGGKDQAAVQEEKGREESTEQAAASQNGGDQKITLLLTYPKEKAVLYQCIEDFTAETGIQVEIQYMPLADSRKQINIMVASDSLPDVMDVDNTDTATYAKMGILADITDHVNSELELDQYYSSILGQNQYEGRYYGLPFTSNNLCLYYNQELLDKAGVTEVPASWDEVLEACGKLKEIGVNGFGVAGSQTTDTTFQIWPFIWGSGSDVDHIDSPETVETLKFYETMVENQYMSTEVVNYNSGDNANQFIAGKTAMIVDGPWRLSSIQADAGFEFGVAKIPEGNAGFKTVLGGHNFAISNTGNVDLSWEFVKYMNRPEVMVKYSEAENYIPSRKDVAAESEYFAKEPIRTFVEMQDYAVAMPVENYNKIRDILIEMWQSVVLGAKDPEQAAKDAGASIAGL